VFYNTCKSPACPSCGHWATIQWQRERWCAIPEVPYLGITFTMPNTLWPLFARNPRLCRKLPEIAAHVIGSYARVRYGVEVGVMPILHTFTGKLQFNSHVHALVTAGGLQTSGSGWRLRIFFVRDLLIRAWQRLVIAILRGALEARQLGIAHDEVERLLQREEKRHWIGHVQAFNKKEHFLRYAGRYARRPPIAQRRILTITDGFVLFWYRDKRRHRRATEQCTIEEFIDRWSQHIPKTLSALCKALRIVCSTPLGACSRSNIRYPRHKAATTTKAPPLGGFDSTAIRPKPARGPQRSANEVCQTSCPCSSLIATRLRQAPFLPRQLYQRLSGSLPERHTLRLSGTQTPDRKCQPLWDEESGIAGRKLASAPYRYDTTLTFEVIHTKKSRF
jgi:Putative transposase